MSDDRPLQRVILLDTDHGAYVQLCRRLAVVGTLPFSLERAEDWHQLQTRIDRGEVQAVLARSDSLAMLHDCGVPVIHLANEPDFSSIGNGLNDTLWDQSSASEIIR